MKRLANSSFPGICIFVFCLYLAGLTLMFISPGNPGVVVWIGTVWSIPAAYGGFTALFLVVREARAARFLQLHPRQPKSMMVDAESGTATVTLMNDEIVSVQIPEEILEEGPEAVVEYCAREFEQEQ